MVQETFLHEVGHSFGADHDPRRGGDCSPSGGKGKYLMYPGPMGRTEVRRAFSSCSVNQIAMALDEFGSLCMESRVNLEAVLRDEGDVVNDKDNKVEVDTEDTEIRCSRRKIMKIAGKLGRFIKDLGEYRADAEFRRFTKTFYQQLVSLTASIDNDKNQDLDLLSRLAAHVRSYPQKEERGELEIYLARKIGKQMKAIQRCL